MPVSHDTGPLAVLRQHVSKATPIVGMPDPAGRYHDGAAYALDCAASGLPWPCPASVAAARGEIAWAKRNNNRAYRAYWVGFLRYSPR